jgi:hypothetical protein
MALEGKAKSLTNYEMTDWQKYQPGMLPANSLNVKTCLVQSDSPARSGGDRAAPLSERNARSADPGLAGPHLREGALSEGTHMLFVINPDLLWLALGFIFSMAGMLATYPE